MSEKDPLENHGDAEEWSSYAPNCTPRLTKAALTQEHQFSLAENQFHAENRKHPPKYSPVPSEPCGFASTVLQRESDVDEQIVSKFNWVRAKKKPNWKLFRS